MNRIERTAIEPQHTMLPSEWNRQRCLACQTHARLYAEIASQYRDAGDDSGAVAMQGRAAAYADEAIMRLLRFQEISRGKWT